MKAETEIWRVVQEFPEYEVSNFGRIRRTVARHYFPAGRLVALSECSAGGYLKASLSRDGKRYTRLVHRVVSFAFHGPPPTPKHEAAHDDGDPKNNRADNLRWKTPLENAADKIRHGTCSRLAGEQAPGAILTDEAVRVIRSTKRYNGVCADLAHRFGVSEKTVSALRVRSSCKWRHVPHQAHPPASKAASKASASLAISAALS